MSISIFLLSIALILGTLLLIFIIYSESQKVKLEKRFDAFSLRVAEENIVSFLDSFETRMNIILKKFSKILKRIPFLKRYAQVYEKYIVFEERNTKDGFQFIATKILIGLTFLLLSILISFIKTKQIQGLYVMMSFVVGFFVYDIFLGIQFHQKKQNIENDLVRAIMIMNNCFKSGKNIMQAIITVKNELDGPISDEFKKIYLDITYGLSLEIVFKRFYDRVKLEDVKYIASSLTLLNKTGGNIINVFESIEKNFYNKKRLQDELKSLTASSMFVYRVLVVLPLLFAFFIYFLNPTYFAPFFQSFIGICLFLFIVLLYFSYIFIIKKVLEVKM